MKQATDTAFQIMASNCRFGSGITHEVGMDLVDLGAKRVLLVIDPSVRRTSTGTVVQQSLEDNKLDFAVFDAIEIEPTDSSFLAASKFATEGHFDAFVAVGGGSTIDTAKAANVFATHPADFLDYVNAPIGKGIPVPGPLKPLIAIPTTAGTGSETTGVAIFDLVSRRVKTGIASKYVRPTLGIVDWDNTRTQPAAVAASAGLDVLSHALESYTAIPYEQRLRPARPSERSAYQGSNPMSDVWALRALEIVAEFLPRAVADTSDDEARMNMILASSMAGIGFGNGEKRRSPPATRDGLSGRGHGSRVQTCRIRDRSPDGAARYVGHPAHSRRRPVHRSDIAAAPLAGGESFGSGHLARESR